MTRLNMIFCSNSDCPIHLQYLRGYTHAPISNNLSWENFSPIDWVCIHFMPMKGN
jgi:hypothetical protein